MSDTSLVLPQFTIDASIREWLAHKQMTRSGSAKTRTAYEETMQSFRDFLAQWQMDLDSSTINIVRLAPLWASSRFPTRLKKDGTPNKRHGGPVSDSTYNQRLAIVSSWYTFVQQVYHLQIPNPIKAVAKRNVQAYSSVLPIDPEVIETGFESIDRDRRIGLRNYAILAVALYTGRRASELVGLHGKDVQILGKDKNARVLLQFHCKGGKVEYNRLDEETSVVFLEYARAQFGEQVEISPEAPVWVSYSNGNRGEAITVQTLSTLCRETFGTSKNHALRHTFADEMVHLGAPITDLASALGHTDIKITQRYVKRLERLAENPLGNKLVARFGIKRKGERK